MKKKNVKNIVCVLIVIFLILLASHLEYEQIQEDLQAQEDCRLQDSFN